MWLLPVILFYLPAWDDVFLHKPWKVFYPKPMDGNLSTNYGWQFIHKVNAQVQNAKVHGE